MNTADFINTPKESSQILFWKELGKNHDYRAVYLGPIDSKLASSEIIETLGIKSLNPGIKNCVVESLWSSHGEISLVLEKIIPF